MERDIVASLRGSSYLMSAYGDRLLSRPAFMTADELARISADLRAVYDLLLSLPERLFDGDLSRYCAAIGWDDVALGLVAGGVDIPPVCVGRADLYHDGTGFKLLELNLSSTVGGYENAQINRAMLEVDEFRQFVEEERLDYVDTLARIVGTLTEYCGDVTFAGRPAVALVDWPASFRRTERRLRGMAELLGGMGFDAHACHVADLSVVGGRLTLHRRPIDVVYRFFTLTEISADRQGTELVAPLLAAHRRGAFLMFAPLQNALYGNKSSLAMLSDERNASAFSADELEVIDRVLPWTRQLRPGRVRVAGGEVELMDHCRANRDSLVLKASNLHTGTGTFPGWERSQSEWEAALAGAVGQPFVVQERILPAAEPFAPAEGGSPGDCVLLWGQYLTAGGYGGCFVRGTDQRDPGVISVANGAAVGCCFHALA